MAPKQGTDGASGTGHVMPREFHRTAGISTDGAPHRDADAGDAEETAHYAVSGVMPPDLVMYWARKQTGMKTVAFNNGRRMVEPNGSVGFASEGNLI